MTVERRCGEDRRDEHPRHDRRGKAADRKYWISPGARLWLVGVSCAIALLLIILLPVWVRQGTIADAQRARDVAAQQSAVQGAKLLHRFDCTYGEATRLTLREAGRAQRVTAHVALGARHAALLRRDRKAAHRSYLSYRSALRARKTYRALLTSLDALGHRDANGNPLPPCPKR